MEKTAEWAVVPKTITDTLKRECQTPKVTAGEAAALNAVQAFMDR